MGVQFERLERLKGVHFGVWWEEFQEDFPKVEEHNALPSIVEPLDMTQPVEIKLQVSDRPPPVRWWFLNQDATRLIQIQNNRFVFNWRKRASSTERYPSYDVLMVDFMKHLKSFCAFVAKGKHGAFVPKMSEITYVDHIVAGKGWTDHSEMHKVISPVSLDYSDDYLPPLESLTFNSSYIFKKDEKALGRLRVNANPAFRGKEKEPIVVMNVSAFARPLAPDIEGIHKALDQAHEWAVRGFASVTPKAMHEVWERTQ